MKLPSVKLQPSTWRGMRIVVLSAAGLAVAYAASYGATIISEEVLRQLKTRGTHSDEIERINGANKALIAKYNAEANLAAQAAAVELARRKAEPTKGHTELVKHIAAAYSADRKRHIESGSNEPFPDSVEAWFGRDALLRASGMTPVVSA